MLSNLETEKEKLIQIILIGQPQLKAKIQTPNLEQFKQRIAVYYHIPGLTKEETKEYILHRLKLVSLNGCDVFTPKAIDLIYATSSGTPRIINLVCDSALLSGYIYETKKITENIINEVIKERDFNYNPDADALYTVHSTRYEQPKIYCCPDCQRYMKCEIKWDRGTKGEEQLCCKNCQDYQRCMDNINKVKLN
jgi:hypothetical protein